MGLKQYKMKGKHDKNYDSDNLKDEEYAQQQMPTEEDIQKHLPLAMYIHHIDEVEARKWITDNWGSLEIWQQDTQNTIKDIANEGDGRYRWPDKLQDQDRDTIEKWQDTRLNIKQLADDSIVDEYEEWIKALKRINTSPEELGMTREEFDQRRGLTRVQAEYWAQKKLNEIQSEEDIQEQLKRGFSDMLLYNQEKYHISDEGVVKHIPIVEPADVYGAKTEHQGWIDDMAEKFIKKASEDAEKLLWRTQLLGEGYIASTDSIQTPVEQEIAKIEVEIKRLKEDGINNDQEDKSPMEEYADAVAANRIVEELEERLAQIRASTTPRCKEGKLIVDVYSSLEEIRDDLFKVGSVEDVNYIRGVVLRVTRRLKATIDAQKYITDGDK